MDPEDLLGDAPASDLGSAHEHRGNIGLATPKRLVEESAYVFIIDRSLAELDKAKKLIRRNVTGVQTDTADSTTSTGSMLRWRPPRDRRYRRASAGTLEHATLETATPASAEAVQLKFREVPINRPRAPKRLIELFDPTFGRKMLWGANKVHDGHQKRIERAYHHMTMSCP